MKTLYLDCGMGAAGDMLAASLLELIPDPDGFIDRMNALGIPGVRVEKARTEKCGILGTRFLVTVFGEEEDDQHHGHDHHDHDHHDHHHLADIEHLIGEHLALSDQTRQHMLSVYRALAEAESQAHGVPVTQVHFHEVGAMDAVADIAAVCLLMEQLSPDEVIASPIRVGSGQVRCAHGLLPVPAPATANLLKGAPIYSGAIPGEFCTPTGAALLRHFVTSFGDMPMMRLEGVGYGMGKKDFEAANCVRAMLGNRPDETDQVVELSCNVDDMTAEEIGFAMERLLEAGAHDVYTVPVGMKKSRPGTLIRTLCRARDKEKIVGAIFKYTTTIGIRGMAMERFVLTRSVETVDTPLGPVRRKRSFGYGVERCKYEYDDLAAIARENGLSIEEVRAKIGQK